MARRLNRLTAPWLLLLFLVMPAVQGMAEEPVSSAGEPRLLVDGEYYPALLERIEAAGESVDLVMFLWKATKSPKNKATRLARALGRASKRGVRTRVVLEDSGYDREINRANRETALQLRQEGVAVFYDSPKVTTHAKLAIIDGRYVFLGSHNLTYSALSRNHEVSLIMDDPALASRLTAYLEDIIAH